MKEVVVCLEHRFYVYGGALYTKLSFPYSYWQDYLYFFSSVKIVARAQEVRALEPGMVRVDGPSVTFSCLPYYVGPREFIFALPMLLCALFKIAKSNQNFLLRSGNSSNLLWLFLMMLRRPYLREYPGNIKEGVIGFAGNDLKYRMLAGFLHWFARLQGRFSKANSFVSEYCQQLYGSSRPGYVFSSFRASEIGVHKSHFAVAPDVFHIVSVGRQESEKGHRILLEAMSLSAYSKKIKLHLVGDGNRRASLEDYALQKSLDVIFYGAVTDRSKLFSIVAAADLFVIPSLTEGMPRALLEAMAVGVPCLGSSVGGIPEVLPQECMCEPNNALELAGLVDRFLESETLRAATSKRNKDFISSRFSDSALQAQKIAFWSKLYE